MRLRTMSYRKELSLEDIAREVSLVSENMERVLPTYCLAKKGVRDDSRI